MFEKLSRSFCVLGLAGMVAAAFAQRIIDPVNGLLVGRFGVNNGTTFTRAPGAGYNVTFPANGSNLVLILPPNTSWAGRSHIDFTLQNNGASIAETTFGIGSGNGNGWLVSSVVIFPRAVLDLSVPLGTAESYGFWVLPSVISSGRPSMLGSERKQTSSRGNIDANQVNTVIFYNTGTESAALQIRSMVVTNHSIPINRIVDDYAQQTAVNWPSKITSVADLRASIPNEPDGVLPYNGDAYLGAADGPSYPPAPRFHTVREANGKWYLVTPTGKRFFSLGVNEVGTFGWSQTQGRENLFTNIGALQTNFPGEFGLYNGLMGYTPYAINLERKWGSGWRSQMDQVFVNRLRSWGFNTLGANSWDTLMGPNTLPSTYCMTITGNFQQIMTYSGHIMPDPFDPAFRASAVVDLTHLMTAGSWLTHAGNIGLYVDNELPWGRYGSSDPTMRYALSYYTLKAPPTEFARISFVANLSLKYNTIAALNSAWRTNYAAWSDLQSGNFTMPQNVTSGLITDFADFSRSYCNRYFGNVRDVITQCGYHGLYLGCRHSFCDWTDEAVETERRFTDVISFNIYGSMPDQFIQGIRSIDFPVLISEMCFGSTDLGRVGMPLYPTLSSQDRVRAYQRYMDNVKSWPNLVGVHWYRWEDNPITGNINHDNMSLGLLNLCDQPYADLVAATRQKSVEMMRNVAIP